MNLPQRGRLHRSFGPLVLAGALWWSSAPVAAQGITTAAIRGAVRAENGADVDGTPVRVVNLATGYRIDTKVRGGSFLIEGLETGGPYTVEVRRIGFVPQTDTVSSLNIGDRRDVPFLLVAAARLDAVIVKADYVDAPSAPGRGIGTSISDSTLRRLPTFNRDMYDFARMAPQVSTRFGLSGGGAPFRFNNYSIDGVSERILQTSGNGAGAVTLTSSNRTIPLEAVKEYQVHLAPFDPRYGDFTSLLVNAVTKRGTNDLHGSVYADLRNAQLARSGSFLGTSSYEREVFGFSLGGPIVRNRIHLFIAPEIQRASQPARGPWVGQASDAPFPVPVLPDTVARFVSLLRDRGLDPGDGGRVKLPNPNIALLGRLDFALPELASRLVLRESYSDGQFSNFQRPVTNHNFPLSSVAGMIRLKKRTTAVQLFSQLSPAVFNEFQLGRSDNPVRGGASAQMPSISVSVVGATLVAGPELRAQGGGSSTGASTEIGDYVVFQPGPSHTLGFGAHVEFFRYAAIGVKTAYGQWMFPNLDAVAAGAPSAFTISRDFGSAASPVAGAEPSLYASDEWRLSDRVSVTLGVRADGLRFSQHPAYNPEVDSVFHRRTTDFPRFRPQWSPRVGFMWQPDDDRRTSIRGGAGLFVGRPPLGWLVGPMRSDGMGIRTLSCAAGNVPAFTPYPAVQPTTCANGSGPANVVTLVDRNLRMAETLRASIGIDQRLPWNLIGGIEALYSRVRSDFGFFNLGLSGPTGIDSHGRVMYGLFGTDGVARPSLVAGNLFSEVVDLRNQTGGYSWSVTGQAHRPWSDRLEMGVSYTYSRVRDVRSITSNMTPIPLDLWAGERPGSGRLDDATLGVSSFEIPHRVVLSATYAARWKHRTTDISLYYIGESGVPFTYGDSTAGPKFTGDLNADGTGANDPIYVPRDATNPSEIAFAGSSDSAIAQGVAFEKFIHSTPCLDRQRGRIVARNSCRSAWVHTSNLSVRQSLPGVGGHAATVQLEVFNVFNLLNKSWGLFEVPNSWILQNAGRTQVPVPQPLYTFNTPSRNVQNAESSYQLQLSLRYSF